MTSRTAPRRPAHHCDRAAHILAWGLIHPGQPVQGWILRRCDRPALVIATIEGYPPGRDPILADAAKAWADDLLGAAQDWIEKPNRSSAFHTHADSRPCA